jgi:integrase
MYPNEFSAPKKKGQITPAVTTASGVSAARLYSPPVLRENSTGCYIEFNAYDPEQGKFRRKKIKINRIKGVANRRKYARDVINRLNEQLKRGWNPWIAKDVTDLSTVTEALERYASHIDKMMAAGYYRKETYAGYKSYLKMLRLFIKERRPIYYTYQFDRNFCVDFLDWVFIERDNGAQTRNNYLNFLRVLSAFLVEKGYLTSKPTDGISPISKRLYQKSRTVIPSEVVEQIAEYCKDHEPYFLLACYLLYYCFIRPVEMTRLKVKDFNVKESTVVIPAESSKNKKTQTVTLPKKVLLYAVEIGVLSAPAEEHIFSYGLKPGTEEIDPKHFRDHWDNVRKALDLKPEWKFYSLKDTGITEMLDKNMTSISVRDQARHSSLLITDIYTRHNAKANKDIVELDGSL